VRQDVVDKLRDDISSGTYKVDAHAIARTIIDLLA
jgi:anti-sigma28 factor (negative regulator of flagellin synthesis)